MQDGYLIVIGIVCFTIGFAYSVIKSYIEMKYKVKFGEHSLLSLIPFAIIFGILYGFNDVKNDD